MKRRLTRASARAMLICALTLSGAALAAFVLDTPDGRRVLLREDGTWQYVDRQSNGSAVGKSDEGALVVQLTDKAERGINCRFGMQLTNELPFEVRTIVLYYSAYRANGVLYDSVSSESGPSKPGNTQRREIEFRGIQCAEIARVQLGGGDRCDMGDLTKYSFNKGDCLAHVRVIASDLVRFDK